MSERYKLTFHSNSRKKKIRLHIEADIVQMRGLADALSARPYVSTHASNDTDLNRQIEFCEKLENYITEELDSIEDD